MYPMNCEIQTSSNENLFVIPFSVAVFSKEKYQILGKENL